jgi:hypothetical protein
MYKDQRKNCMQIKWQDIALNLYCPKSDKIHPLQNLKITYHLTNIKTNIIKLKMLNLSNKIEKSSLVLNPDSTIKNHSKRHTITHQIRPT